MTMYVAVELHDFVFFAADKRVTTKRTDGTTDFSDDVTKLKLVSGGIVTGCGLENVIEQVADAMSNNGLTWDEKKKLNAQFPVNWLNSTRVVIAPTGARENERLLSLHFGDYQKDKLFDLIGGLVDGSAGIANEHQHLIMMASSDFVRNKHQAGAFERFLEQIGDAFSAVSSASNEVSSLFDYALQYPDGKQYFNSYPDPVTGT